MQADLKWEWEVRIASGAPPHKGTQSSAGLLIQPVILVVLDPKLDIQKCDKTPKRLDLGQRQQKSETAALEAKGKRQHSISMEVKKLEQVCCHMVPRTSAYSLSWRQ